MPGVGAGGPAVVGFHQEHCFYASLFHSPGSSRSGACVCSLIAPNETKAEVLCDQESRAVFCCCGEGLHGRNNGRDCEVPKWEKVLWRRQPYPDNYVDQSFLGSISRNANLRTYVYADLCKATAAITQHGSLLVIFVVTYLIVQNHCLPVMALLAFDMVLLCVGFCLRYLADLTFEKLWRGLRSTIVGLGCLRILCPILRTLTQSFSDDTVVCLCVVSLLVHLALTDYSYIYRNPGKIDESFTRAMSINAALLANVVLASRLDSSTEVFAVLVFGIEMFALSPMTRRVLWQKYPWAFVHVITPALIFVTGVLLSAEAPGSIVIVFLFCAIFVTFVGPYWLIMFQKYKNEIKGPWDVAEVPSYSS
ncbi:phosphatidylinositol n-acetylglucosaminyltransferase [Cystoisospora suis]|uniref:Phosphatidylinositol n-acetylglucosaminyltransferase n=1 Tax=Cystoisospora suis TaxID=483139 RepID=A0A2C6L1A4_9APIC|nr:phosphatidylinositol n-acetylglucosaminyltransferase [Cystoisospora suis]